MQLVSGLWAWLEDHPAGFVAAYVLVMLVGAWSWRAHPAIAGAAFGLAVGHARPWRGREKPGSSREAAAWSGAALLLGLAIAYGAPGWVPFGG